jgi:hypothetical protein
MPGQKSRREMLAEGICDQISRAVREELVDAPSSLAIENHTAIEDEILSHTKLVMDALSSAEMTSEGALLSHIANARFETNRLIRERLRDSGFRC